MLTIDATLYPFGVGDYLFLQVSSLKGVIRFGRCGNIHSRYIVLFEILRQIDEVAYELALPLSFSAIHPVFHISMVYRYILYESHMFEYDSIKLDDYLTFVKEPIAILARDVR